MIRPVFGPAQAKSYRVRLATTGSGASAGPMALDDRLARERFCHLTTIGRRTGAPRRIEIWFAAAPGPDTVYLLAGGR